MAARLRIPAIDCASRPTPKIGLSRLFGEGGLDLQEEITRRSWSSDLRFNVG